MQFIDNCCLFWETNGSMADENKKSLVEQVPPSFGYPDRVHLFSSSTCHTRRLARPRGKKKPTSWEDGSLGNEPTWVGQPTVKQHGRCEQ